MNKADGLKASFCALTPKSKKGSEEKFVKLLRDSGVEVHTIYFTKSLVGALSQLTKLCRKESIEVIHSHLLHADVIASMLKRYYCRKITHVSTKHGYEEYYNNKFGFDPSHRIKNKYWRVARWAEKTVTKSYAISKGLQNLYIGLEICRADKLELIYYGFDFDFELDKKKENDRFKLVMVGRLTEFKGHRYAIEACRHLKDRGVDFDFDIVGNGELDETLKQQVHELDLEDCVHFLGYQENGYRFMIDADVVLIPSVAEGFGVVVLEAMAANSAIVGFDVPAINETIINESTGLLVPPYDTELYATAVQRLAEDLELRKKLVAKADQRLRSYFCQDRMIQETISFYSSLQL